MTTGIDPAAIATELRLGRSSRENAETKGARYLLEGRVRMRSLSVQGLVADVRGQGHLWRVEWTPRDGWFCNCPAKSRCAHLVAVQHVVAIPSGAS